MILKLILMIAGPALCGVGISMLHGRGDGSLALLIAATIYAVEIVLLIVGAL